MFVFLTLHHINMAFVSGWSVIDNPAIFSDFPFEPLEDIKSTLYTPTFPNHLILSKIIYFHLSFDLSVSLTYYLSDFLVALWVAISGFVSNMIILSLYRYFLCSTRVASWPLHNNDIVLVTKHYTCLFAWSFYIFETFLDTERSFLYSRTYCNYNSNIFRPR